MSGGGFHIGPFITCKLQHSKADWWCRFHAALTAISLHQLQRQPVSKNVLYIDFGRARRKFAKQLTSWWDIYIYIHIHIHIPIAIPVHMPITTTSSSTGSSHLKGPLSCHVVPADSSPWMPWIPWIPRIPGMPILFRVVVQCRVLLHPRRLAVVLLPNPCQLAKLFVKIACGSGIKLARHWQRHCQCHWKPMGLAG